MVRTPFLHIGGSRAAVGWRFRDVRTGAPVVNNGSTGKLRVFKHGTWLRVAIGLALATLLVNAFFLVDYLFNGYRVLFHSDSAVKVLLAREIAETGSWFPKDWNYVNGDLFVLFGHTVIVPLLAFAPAGFAVHAVAGLVTSLLILAGLWLVSGLAPIGIARRLLVVAVFASGISGFMAENLYGQVSYGIVVCLSCFILFFSWRYLQTEGMPRAFWGSALFLIVVLAVWANPQRALVYYGLPLLAAASYLFAGPEGVRAGAGKKSLLLLFGVVGSGAVCGGYAHALILHGVNSVQGVGDARWLPYELMVRNASLLLKEHLAIFGGLPTAKGLVASKDGIYEAARLMTALSLLGLAPRAIVSTLRRQDVGTTFFCMYAVVAFLLVLLLQVATTVPEMSDPIQSARYFVPAAVLLLLFVLIQPIDFSARPIEVGTTIVLVLVLVSSAYSTFVLSGRSSESRTATPQRSSKYQGLADFLAAQGLRYGYASYWQAGVISVLSAERVLVRQVVFQKGLPMPMRHLSSNRWYRPSAWTGETFLLVGAQEAKAFDQTQLAILGVKIARELEFGEYKVYVFAENLAGKLPGWDWTYEVPARYPASKHSLSRTGRLIEDGTLGGPALVAEKGEAGVVHFGPYVNVEPGRYAVSFDIVAANNPAGVARIDVASAGVDAKILGERILTESAQPQEIVFSLDQRRSMEFRAWSLGRERVVLRGVTIRRAAQDGS